jgi:hypothetical protein
MRYIDRNADPKSHAGHEMRIDRLEKHPAASLGLPFGAASYYGPIDSGSAVPVEYADFVTTDDTVFSMTDGKLHTLEEGTYAFFSAAYVYPSGSPAATSEVVLTPSVTADSFGAFPASFYWPDFGMYKVTGYSTGTLSWSPHMLLFRTYNSDNIGFPTDQQILMTIPFATSNCIVSTLALQMSKPLLV